MEIKHRAEECVEEINDLKTNCLSDFESGVIFGLSMSPNDKRLFINRLRVKLHKCGVIIINGYKSNEHLNG